MASKPYHQYRYKGRKMGTAIGAEEQNSARRHRLQSHIEDGLGATQGVLGAGTMALGAVMADPFSMMAGAAILDSAHGGGKTREKASREAAHATAVESLVAKSRGGSAALGMKGVVPKKQSNADRMRAGAMHLDGPKPTVDYRTGKGIPGPDGISPAARELSKNVDAQREGWESMRRNNPDLAKELDSQGMGAFKPQSERDVQDAFDAIHKGSGGRSNGMGQVWKGNDAPPGMQHLQDSDWEGLRSLVSAVGNLKMNYGPNDRQSTNIEDRRSEQKAPASPPSPSQGRMMKLGGPTPGNAAPPPAAPKGKRTVADKYTGARTAIGEHILAKARGERLGSKFFKTLGHVTQMGSVGLSMATAQPEIALAGLPAGTASQMVGAGRARTAENMRLKSRAIDNLITRHRTGTTIGANPQGMQRNWTPTEKHTSGHIAFGLHLPSFTRANAKFTAAQKQQQAAAPASPGAGTGRKGWSNAARIQAAKAKGYQNLPYGGQDDGMGQ